MIDTKDVTSVQAPSRSRLQLVTSPGSPLGIGTPEFIGRKVRDQDGRDIGRVDGCLVGSGDESIRFLRIGSGGFLGRGTHESFVPLEIVTATDGDIRLASSADKVRQAPTYGPDIVDERMWMEASYRHFGHKLS